MNFLEYISTNKMQILNLVMEHIELTIIAVGISILIGVPLGILISYVKKLNKPILAVTNVIQAIPSMALLGFSIPLLGIGSLPAIVMVTLYSLLPIIKNTYIGISNIDEDIVEAAKGIGLNRFQRLFKIQIPLALPVIMAGVRISAVTAVGLMTMAAFIGAGGLGFLIFSGIRTVNNFQILAGAIPACILALMVDYLFGLLETVVTPISLQVEEGKTIDRTKSNTKRNIILTVAAALIVLIVSVSVVGNFKKEKTFIRVGSKDYTEQHILGHMFSDIIEDRTDIKVERNINLGGTMVCFNALKADEIDMYIEYTGTMFGEILGKDPVADMEFVYKEVRTGLKEEFGIDVLNQIGFNNTYAIAMEKATADKYGLEKISDLKNHAENLKIGGTFEFINRGDGLSGLQEAYGLNFKDSLAIDGAARYIALNNQEVDMVDAFGTDGLLKKFDLFILEDDEEFFLPYYPVPIMSKESIERYPEVKEILEEFDDFMTTEMMMELNYLVDEKGIEPDVVAREFLIEEGIISK